MGYKVIDKDTWPRAEHFSFYQQFSHPWYNICAQLDMTALYQFCKQREIRFFHAYLYLTQQALNAYPPINCRIVGDEVRLYDAMCVSVTVLADDETVRFCDLPHEPDFNAFVANTTAVEADVKALPFKLEQFVGKDIRQDTIHMTVLPWIDFTSMSNARDTVHMDSIPKLALGKLTQQGDQWRMPIALDVHHGVMDGLHVGRFLSILQAHCDEPDRHLS